MSQPSPLVLILIGAGAAVGIWMLLRADRRYKRKEGFNGTRWTDFERDYLMNADAGHGRYWRSAVNYASKPWENPHYQANPHDETLPLEMASMAPGLQMIPPYVPMLTGGQYTPGPNDTVPTMPDDFSTSKSLYANGNMDYKRWLHGSREDGVVGNYATDLNLSGSL